MPWLGSYFTWAHFTWPFRIIIHIDLCKFHTTFLPVYLGAYIYTRIENSVCAVHLKCKQSEFQIRNRSFRAQNSPCKIHAPSWRTHKTYIYINIKRITRDPTFPLFHKKPSSKSQDIIRIHQYTAVNRNPIIIKKDNPPQCREISSAFIAYIHTYIYCRRIIGNEWCIVPNRV